MHRSWVSLSHSFAIYEYDIPSATTSHWRVNVSVIVRVEVPSRLSAYDTKNDIVRVYFHSSAVTIACLPRVFYRTPRYLLLRVRPHTRVYTHRAAGGVRRIRFRHASGPRRTRRDKDDLNDDTRWYTEAADGTRNEFNVQTICTRARQTTVSRITILCTRLQLTRHRRAAFDIQVASRRGGGKKLWVGLAF